MRTYFKVLIHSLNLIITFLNSLKYINCVKNNNFKLINTFLIKKKKNNATANKGIQKVILWEVLTQKVLNRQY